MRFKVFARAAAVVALGVMLSAPLSDLRAQEASIAAPQLARVWDAEHVSPPLPP